MMALVGKDASCRRPCHLPISTAGHRNDQFAPGWAQPGYCRITLRKNVLGTVCKADTFRFLAGPEHAGAAHTLEPGEPLNNALRTHRSAKIPETGATSGLEYAPAFTEK